MSHFIYCYAECHYAECHFAECRYAVCHYAEYRGALACHPAKKVNKAEELTYLSTIIGMNRELLLKGRLSTVDLLIKMGCFVNKENLVSVLKAADINLLVEGGQPY